MITSFRYDDRYVRLGGRWVFAARQVRTLYAMTHAELASGGLGWDQRKRWPHRAPSRAELPAWLPGGTHDSRPVAGAGDQAHDSQPVAGAGDQAGGAHDSPPVAGASDQAGG